MKKNDNYVTYELIDYFDVYGNEEDGWEVNNLAPIEEITIDIDDITEEELIDYLVQIEYFNNKASTATVEVEWYDPDFIEFFDKDTYEPLCRLQRK